MGVAVFGWGFDKCVWVLAMFVGIFLYSGMCFGDSGWDVDQLVWRLVNLIWDFCNLAWFLLVLLGMLIVWLGLL